MNLNFKILSDSELLVQTKKVVTDEREATNFVLDHLREVEQRYLYAKLKYSSMFEYCTKELKYCNASAQLRIDAMRLSKDVPELKESLENGTLNLSVIGTVQKFIRHQKAKKKGYSPEQKRALLKQVEKKSKLETEQFFTTLSPEFIPHEKKKVLSPTQTEIRFVANPELLELMELMKCKLIQKGNSDPSCADIFREGLKKALKVKADFSEAQGPELENNKKSQTQTVATSPGEVAMQSQTQATSAEEVKREVTQRPYISVSVRREVSKKSQDQCTYISPITKERCSEKRFLHVEHRVPFAKGGSSRLKNLILLCATHNRLRAVEQFGLKKMQSYLK